MLVQNKSTIVGKVFSRSKVGKRYRYMIELEKNKYKYIFSKSKLEVGKVYKLQGVC